MNAQMEGVPRIGLLGGAFDPPHRGHLKLAELAWRTLGLDHVRFIPTARPPHKGIPDGGASADARLHLLEKALAEASGPFRVDPLELEREGPSYTVDTLETLSVREPGIRWIWIIGSDQLALFPLWHHPERILELASLAVSPRPGHECDVPDFLKAHRRDTWSGEPGTWLWLPSTDLELSSTALRKSLALGTPPEGLSQAVGDVIRLENLYR